MSSHHIVKENQEPALLVTSFDALDREYIGQLLEWSPTVFTGPDTMDFLLAEEIKVDYVITNHKQEFAQTQVKIIPRRLSVVEDTLQYLVEHHYDAVNIVCDSIPEVVYRYAGRINIVLFVGGKRYVLVQSKYEKWKQAGEEIYVCENQLKSLVGILKIGKDRFRTQQDGFIYLEFNNGEFVLVGEEI